jgi:hypothetical protein
MSYSTKELYFGERKRITIMETNNEEGKHTTVIETMQLKKKP